VDAQLPSGAREYFAQTTAGAMAKRAGMGLAESVFHIGDSLAFVAPPPGTVLHVTWVVLGVIAAVAAVRALWRWERGFLRTFLLVHTAWWVVFLVIFTSGGGGASRYFLPLVATTLLPVLAARLVDRDAPPWRSRWARALGAAAIFAMASTLVLDRRPTRPPAGFLEVQDWLVHHVGDGEVYAVDARTHLQPRWLAPRAQQLIVSASWQSKPVPTADIIRYLCEQRVRYVLIDGGSVTNVLDGTASRYLFYDRMPLDPDGALPLQGFPAGMRPVYVGSESPRRWMVLSTSCPTAG
jgi:hypothetical protein